MFLGLRQVCIAVSDINAAVTTLSALFDVECSIRDDPHVSRHGLRNAVLPFGSAFIELLTPFRDGTPVGRHLERVGGDAGYMLILDTDDFGFWEHHLLIAQATVVREGRDGTYCFRQIHPKSVGGVLLSIDADGIPNDGRWHPAGSNWRAHVRNGRVNGLSGVKLESAAPFNLAARWSKVLDRQLQDLPGADPVLALDAATIRFAEGQPGSFQCMTGVKVHGDHVQKCIEAAAALGLQRGQGWVRALGMTFELEATEPKRLEVKR
ncbi:hypothetical protein [Bradyrhizobium sp. 153]|uniref:hypothetical protein n=1 Tax=Bradyrhizobium sp. 153 TaxID=2782627 RepID=UPI001FFBBC51|nr:hypothetical protein [Bradyrhizobium sp. 153]MCK1667702.1 VOC family protein [Bradyrhizobium sp. 153]